MSTSQNGIENQDSALVSLYGDALDYAARMSSRRLTTLHFLLAFFSTPSEAAVIFEEKKITYKDVAKTYNEMVKTVKLSGLQLKEADNLIAEVEANAKKYLLNPAQPVTPTHFLAALTNQRNSIAFRIFEKLDVVTDLRLAAMKLIDEPTTKVQIRAQEMKHESTKISLNGKLEKREDQKSAQTQKRRDAAKSDLGSSLSAFGKNLTELAKGGKIDPIFGRTKEVETIIDILGRKNNNNPLIIGPAGSGKTAIVESLALRQLDGLLPNFEIWELNLPSLISGTEYRGALEKRVSELINLVEKNRERLLIFIDEIHLIFSSGDEVVANMLKPLLARGSFPLIGATTTNEFNRYIAKDPAMERRFSIIKIEEPQGEDLYKIAVNAAGTLSKYHGVTLDEEALVRDAIALSSRYISGKSQPDKVLSLLDALGSVLKRERKNCAAKDDLLALVSDMSGIPFENLQIDASKIINLMPDFLNRSIIGQNGAKERLIRLLARKFNNKISNKPIASMIFAGPTGTGKTETAKKMALFLFGKEEKAVVFDMSEFLEEHSVSKLIGSPPGYVGFEEGGKLTEAFRREPYQLLLLDEIEKAHPKVLSIFLQILEEGRVSDKRGFVADLSKSIVVMTTNLGAELFSASRVGFGDASRFEVQEKEIIDKIEGFLSPELVNRVDDVVVFKPFSEEEFLELSKIYIKQLVKRIEGEGICALTIDDVESAAVLIVSKMTSRDRLMGARAVKRLVGKHLESAIIEEYYKNNEKKSSMNLRCYVDGSDFVFFSEEK